MCFWLKMFILLYLGLSSKTLACIAPFTCCTAHAACSAAKASDLCCNKPHLRVRLGNPEGEIQQMVLDFMSTQQITLPMLPSCFLGGLLRNV